MRQLASEFWKKYKSAALLGVGCAFWCLLLGSFAGVLSFVSGLLLFLAGVPLFYAYFSEGSRQGIVSAVIAAVLIVLIMPIPASFDILLNIIFPTTLVGYLSMKNLAKNHKIWWYPESFIVQNLVILSSVILVILSLTVRTESALTKIYEEALKIIAATNNSSNPDYYITILNPVLQSVVRYYNGVAILFNMFTVLCCRQIAYNLGKRFKTNTRPEFDITNISISPYFAIFPLITFTLSKMMPLLSYIFSGLFVVTLFAPSITGFSIIIFAAKKRHLKKLPLITAILLCLFPFHTIFIAAFIGAFDSFYPIRKSLSN